MKLPDGSIPMTQARTSGNQLEQSPIPRAYDLGGEGGAVPFLDVLRNAADAFLREAERCAGDLLDGHMAFVAAGEEPLRSRGEYAVELLSYGILRAEYGTLAAATPDSVVQRMAMLWRLRSEEPARKVDADAERGRIFLELLRMSADADVSADDGRLVAWLEATGEFVQEALRLRTWVASSAMTGDSVFHETADALAAWFVPMARRELGAWTQGVAAFRAHVLESARAREDLFLVTRSEPLYHLNMVGAEVMNRGFLPGYLGRPDRVVLVPGCMRARDDASCRARRDGLDISCTRCHPDCEVAALDRLAEERGFRVYVVPHASTFTAWLRHWRKEPNTSLVAVACPLHLVTGGYEMRALGLEAQCVLLQYSGCKRHWDPDGVPTRLDRERLMEVVALALDSCNHPSKD